MNATIIATIAGLVTALGWGVADWVTGKVSKKSDPTEINFTVQVTGAIVLGSALLLSGVPLPGHSDLLRIAFYGVCIPVGYMFFINALAAGAVGIIVPLSSIYPLVTLLLTVVFLGSTFAGLQIAAMVGIVLGALLLAYEKNHKKIPAKQFHRATIFALSASAVWGTGFFVINPMIGRVPWQAIAGLNNIVSVFTVLIFLAYKKRRQTIQSINRALSNKTTLMTGSIYALAAVSLYVGSQHAGSLIIPLVLSSSAPLVASVLAAIFDHEKIGALKRAGALVVILGIIILNTA